VLISIRAVALRESMLELVRFLVVELTHSDSNPIFDIDIVFTTDYSFSGR
jgi:hypothetical protein